MTCLARLASLIGLGLGLGIALSRPAAARDLWIDNVSVVSAERAQPLLVSTVRIHDGRIAELAHRAAKGTRDPADVIDGTGMYLSPGLIDSHVHLFEIPGMTPEQEKAHPEIARAARAQFPKSYLYFGFTTLVDLVSTAQAIAQWNAHPIHPDTYFCGGAPILDGYPMSFIPKPVRYQFVPYYLVEPGHEADLPPGADPAAHTPAAVVSRMKADGAICVKTFFERGFGAAHDLPVPQAATIRALVQAAHGADLPVLMHANSSEAQTFALATGVDILAHGLWNWQNAPPGAELNADVTKILQGVLDAKRGWQPTIQVLYGERNLFNEAFLTDPMLAKALPSTLIDWYKSPEGQWFHDRMAKTRGSESIAHWRDIDDLAIARVNTAVAFLAKHDARLLFGSDTPSDETFANPPGLNGWFEIHRLQDAGMTPAQIFKAATLSNAEALHLNSQIGSVEVGKRANLLLLREDPSKTVRAYDRIVKVILHGEVLDPSELAANAAASHRPP